MICLLKRAVIAVLLLTTAIASYGQGGEEVRVSVRMEDECAGIKWINPIEAGAEVHGQGWKELRHTYFRLPSKAEGKVPGAVWNLSRQSAGLYLRFRAKTPFVKLRYRVTGSLDMFHMPSTGVSGMDLYATDGKVQEWCAPKFPVRFGKDLITYEYPGINPDMEYVFDLYMPLYNGVEWLEIGVPEACGLEFLPVPDEKPVVIYGTSITQGACASRPGNAWTSIVGRRLGCTVVNLGFSGSGKAEPEMFEMMSEIDASIYVIDCMANMNRLGDKVRERIIAGVEMLRETHDCPILLLGYCGVNNGITDTGRNIDATDAALEAAYRELRSRGVRNLYYLKGSGLGLETEDTVEGLHLNDVGMRHVSNSVARSIRRILRRK